MNPIINKGMAMAKSKSTTKTAPRTPSAPPKNSPMFRAAKTRQKK
jgi:hypothetical protein